MFIFNETQRDLLNTIETERIFIEENGEKTSEFPYKNIQRLKEIGYTKSSLAIENGGRNLKLYDFLLCQERLGEMDGPTSLSIGWHIGITMELRENQRWEKELYTWLCNEIEKGALVNRAASERNTGSPTRGGLPESTAKLVDGEWIINGRKIFTTLAPVLDYFLVSATIDGTDEIGDFLIPRQFEGVEIEETWDSISMSTTGSHDLILNQVKVPSNYLVENISKSRKENPKSTGWLLHIPACYLGIASRARLDAIKFAKSYTPNSIQAPISTLPNIQTLVGEMDVLLYQARSALYSVARAYDESTHPQNLSAELGAAKTIVTNAAIQIVDRAMRIVGLRGLSKENPMHRYYLNVRAGLHNPPMDDAVLKILANKSLS